MTTNQTTERAAGHTPGPWSIDGSTVFVKGYAEQFRPIRVRSAAGYKHVESANARLIAAAPDLLAALEAMVRMCEGESGMGAGYWETVREYYEAKRAIAKAKGVAT